MTKNRIDSLTTLSEYEVDELMNKNSRRRDAIKKVKTTLERQRELGNFSS
jgi:hypothetical protein